MGNRMSMQFSGDDALLAHLKQLQKMEDVKRVVHENTARMQVKAQARTGVTYMHPTGATKRSIGLTIDDNGLSGTVYMGTEYSPYLENGTRFMAARPVLKPTFISQQITFLNELRALTR